MSKDIPQLMPGDHLLYSPSDLFGLITAIKTWSIAVHIEVYVGECKSVASRNGKGVKVYPFRRDDLCAVLRPKQAADLDSGMLWFYSKAVDQKYDWKGLLCFFLAVRQGAKDRMFCSEFAARLDRHSGLVPFHPCFDADKIAPGSFFMSPAFEWVWIR